MKNLKLLIVSVLFVIIGVFSFMRNAFNVPVGIETPIILSTTGLRNAASSGTEIRIKNILVNDVDILPQISLAEGWKMDGELLVSYENDALEFPLTIPVNNASAISINFIGQRGSGNVSIMIDNEKIFVDLYRDSDWEEISWTFKTPTKFSPYLRIDIIFEMILITWILMRVFVFWKKCKC